MSEDEMLERLRKYDSFLEERIGECSDLIQGFCEKPLFVSDRRFPESSDKLSDHQNSLMVTSFQNDILVYRSAQGMLCRLFPELRERENEQ